MNKPLFRGVPAGAHVPPPPPDQLLPVPTTTDYEAADRYFDPGILQETRVMQTSRRWRGIDVYVTLPFFTVNLAQLNYANIATVRVYAINRGTRTLVKTGRVSANLNTVSGPVWICAVRVQAERFEVTFDEQFVVTSAPAAGEQQPQINVSVIASDECVDDPPDRLGCLPWSGYNDATIGRLTNQANVQLGPVGNFFPMIVKEIVAVDAFNTVASPRILVITPTGGLSATSIILGFGMPFQGSPVFDTQMGLDLLLPTAETFLSNFAHVKIVTPALALGANGDVFWQVWWR